MQDVIHFFLTYFMEKLEVVIWLPLQSFDWQATRNKKKSSSNTCVTWRWLAHPFSHHSWHLLLFLTYSFFSIPAFRPSWEHQKHPNMTYARQPRFSLVVKSAEMCCRIEKFTKSRRYHIICRHRSKLSMMLGLCKELRMKLATRSSNALLTLGWVL